MNPFETPQEMVKELSGMPLTILLAMFVVERLPMSETAVGSAVRCTRKSARKHLLELKERGLIFKTKRFSGWDLTPQARQLPFAFLLPTTTQIENGRSRDGEKLGDGMGKDYPSTGKDYPSAQVIHSENGVDPTKTGARGKDYPSSGKDYPSTGKDYPSDTPYIRPTDRQTDINNNINSVNKSSPHPLSVSMLRQFGIDGDLEAMAWVTPSELIGAWWMCQWGERPRRVLPKHLLDRRPIDPLYVALAEWRMVCGETAVDVLVDLICADKRPLESALPDGLTLDMYDVAAKVYEDMGDLPLWI